MEDYKRMYFDLFNQLTNVIEQLKEIQVKAEEMYVNADSDKNACTTNSISIFLL